MEEKIITQSLRPAVSQPSQAEVFDLVSELVENKEYRRLKAIGEAMEAPDVADILGEFDKREQAVLFRLLSKEQAAEVFVELDSDTQEHLIHSFTDTELSEVLSELYIDDLVDVVEEMPAVVVKRILRSSDPADRAAINQILKYPKNSAGSVMTTEYVRFIEGVNVEAALLHIRRVAIDKETIYTCYVTDKDRHLTGVVTARELLIADPQTPLTDFMERNVLYAHTNDNREEVALTLNKYGLLALPVVDSEQRLVGIITLDDALDVLKEESEADFAKMAAITPTEKPYLKTSVISLFLSRVPWLLLLMLSSTISGAILSGFEAALPAVLVLFVPMIMGTGGNSGGQSSVTVTRSISLAEVAFSDIHKVFFKELRVGILCGTVLGAVTFGKVMLIDGLLLGYSDVSLTVALAVSLSLAMTIIVSKMIGAILPLLAKKVGLDPAVMASPLITTLVDAVSLVVYFIVAKSVIGI